MLTFKERIGCTIFFTLLVPSNGCSGKTGVYDLMTLLFWQKKILKKKNMKTSWNLFIFLVSSYIRHSVSGDDNYEGGLNPTPTRKQLNTYLLNYLFFRLRSTCWTASTSFQLSCLAFKIQTRAVGTEGVRGQSFYQDFDRN